MSSPLSVISVGEITLLPHYHSFHGQGQRKKKNGGKTLDLHLSSRHKQNEYENLAFSTRTLVTKGTRGFNKKYSKIY